MKAGTENRKKTIIAGAFISAAVIALIYVVITQIIPTFSSGPSSTPPPTTASSAAEPATTPTSATPAARHTSSTPKIAEPPAAGVAATKLASTSSSLDPTLDERAMLRTESLVYTGIGRNIFSASSYAPEIVIPQATQKVRKNVNTVIAPPPPPAPPATCPPTCPPINLKFFGTVTRANGLRQAFLLDGEDVYLASQGDIVARKYKIASISASSIQVEDLANHNTQTLPLTSN